MCLCMWACPEYRECPCKAACWRMPAGANDTANAAGPYAAVQHMYRIEVDSCGAVNTPVWVLAFCGLGIVTVSALTSDLTPSLC